MFFAIIALWRGHNQPGGGFIGGLLAALAVVYTALAYDIVKARKSLKWQPQQYIAFGITAVFMSVLPSILTGKELMKGSWISLKLIGENSLKLGTPLLFDVGVFLVVIGVVLLFLFTLSTKE